jgi:predicted metal-dependent phosphoesterase TrpH
MLLCDFHIHTRYSDGSVELSQVIDLFGQAGFDVIAITDHVVNGDNAIGKMGRFLGLSVTEENYPQYMAAVKEEAKRAWARYRMLVIPGVEISKNYLSSDKSAHLLLLDLQEFVPASWEYDRIFTEARRQDALVVACHPHHQTDPTAKDTLFLWNHRDQYARHIDAWEIANRDDVFNVISLKKFPYIANSDFHKVRHLYSWKTLLNCEKEANRIKRCIRHNQGVAITLFRNEEQVPH